MNHFIIARFTIENNFHIIPITDDGRDLVAHCNQREDKLVYQALEQAQLVADTMENAIESKLPFVAFQETGYNLS
jgi:hypothetical protein